MPKTSRYYYIFRYRSHDHIMHAMVAGARRRLKRKPMQGKECKSHGGGVCVLPDSWARKIDSGIYSGRMRHVWHCGAARTVRDSTALQKYRLSLNGGGMLVHVVACITRRCVKCMPRGRVARNAAWTSAEVLCITEGIEIRGKYSTDCRCISRNFMGYAGHRQRRGRQTNLRVFNTNGGQRL